MPFVGAGHVMLLVILLLLAGFVIAIAYAIIASSRRSVATGPSAMTAERRECPACKEWMRRDASICPHCHTPSQPWTLHDGRWWVVNPDASYYLDEPSRTWLRYEPTAGGRPE